MTRTSVLALVLAGAVLAGCGSSAPSARTSIVQFVRASQATSGFTHEKFAGVRVSKLDPNYATAREAFTRTDGMPSVLTWILRRDGSTWRVTSKENMFPVCSAAPAKVRKELTGSAGCYPAAGVYTSFEWTPGRQVTLRYCQRPGGPGNFLAASKGVTCATAAAVIRELGARCPLGGWCDVAPFRCRSFGAYARCTDGVRRVLWNAG